mmetsp:Transcript_43126/g.138682  ORF Transcript_43126/g.138682 Transcript_43126/m.138682 type:complete len:614 (+) Transcript_43126:98-1939(+)
MSLAFLAAAARQGPGGGASKGSWPIGTLLTHDIPVLPSYCSKDGPPHIRCGSTFSDQLANVLSGGAASASSVAVHVEWGDADVGGPFTLMVRCRGVELARAAVAAMQQTLALEIEQSDASPPLQPGECFVFELSWPSGSRHLHVLAPLGPSCLAHGSLVSVALTGAELANTRLNAEQLMAPRFLMRFSSVVRGLGIEIETLTALGPGRLGVDATGAVNPGAGAALDALVERCVESSPPHSLAIARRCQSWVVGEDNAIVPALERAAQLAAEAAYPAGSDHAKRARQLLLNRGTHKTEFKSPAPPTELSFGDGAADEIRCMLALVSRVGVAAPSIHQTHAIAAGKMEPEGSACDSGCAIHVHINVRNADARGKVLSALEIVHVVLAWVRFDLVTSRFARAWYWREPSCAPLFASGVEFWPQQRPAQSSHIDGWAMSAQCGVGESVLVDQANEGGAGQWQVPEFVASVHSMLRSEAFIALDDEDQVRALFGEGSPAASLGRYCSLNLKSVMKYGTLEVRRFHTTLDGDVLAHWAHLLVCFVEVFGTGGAGGVGAPTPTDGGGGYSETGMLEMPLPEALAALRAAQESATPAMLMDALRSCVDPATAEALMADALG